MKLRSNLNFLQTSLIYFLLVLSGSGIFYSFSAEANTGSNVLVEFRLNMSKAVKQLVFHPDSDQVFLVLDHGFSPLRLVQGPNEQYTVIVETGLDSGVAYHYRFRINDNIFEIVNRTLIPTSGNQTCTNWWNDDPANITTFKVNMEFAHQQGLFNPLTDSVVVLGTMNNWRGSKAMHRIDTTFIYSVDYVLEPFQNCFYKYRINHDSSGLELIGKSNRYARIPDTLLTLVSDFNNYNPGKRLLTLTCNMSYYAATSRFNPEDYVDIECNFDNGDGNNVLSHISGDTLCVLNKYLDTTWFHQQPLEFKFRINGKNGLKELIGNPARTYQFHDTTGNNPNVYSCYFNNLNPGIPTPPWAYNVGINGLLVHKKILNGIYSYENVNGIPEGQSRFKWYRSNNALGLNAVAIDSAWKLNYIADTVDIGYWLVFEVTPQSVSGDSATGKPVRVVSLSSISAWDVGMVEISRLDFTVYPNPVEDILHIKSPDGIENIEIYGLTGERVFHYKSTGNRDQITLFLNDLPRGLYLVKADNKDGKTGIIKLLKN